VQMLRKQILQIKDEGSKSHNSSQSIMTELVHSDLPESENTLPTLAGR